MWTLLSTYGSRGDAELMVGLAVRPPVFDAATEECDAPVVTGVMPIGVWR